MKISRLLFALTCSSLFFFSMSLHADEKTVKEISICTTSSCNAADKQYSAEQLLNQLQLLLAANQNEIVPMCDADSKTRICKSTKVCHFVLGGIIPGNGCSQSLTFSETTKNEQNTQVLMKAKMPLTFIGTPLSCAIASSTLSVNSMTDIVLQLKPHFCSWMAVGAMSAKLTFNIDSINIDSGEIGGYWQHSVRGTGNGSGSGYLVLKFPKNISWLADAHTNTESNH